MTNKRNGREKVAFINEAKKRRSGDAFQSRGSLKKLKRDNSSPSTTSSPVKVHDPWTCLLNYVTSI